MDQWKKCVDDFSCFSVIILSNQNHTCKIHNKFCFFLKITSLQIISHLLLIRNLSAVSFTNFECCFLFILQSEGDEGAETTRKQLLGCCLSLQIASEECVDSLLNVWRHVVRRVYHYYQLSAKAYFTYLQLNGEVSPL